MIHWKNDGDKRVCDLSDDRKVILIEHRGYVTKITANLDGTLNIENIHKEYAA